MPLARYTNTSSQVVLSRRDFVGLSASAAGVSALVALVGCAPGQPTTVPSDDDATAVVTIGVVDNAYEQTDVTVKVGEAVRWEFRGVNEHDVVAKDASFVSELMSSGSYTHVFDQAGDFEYFCSVHPEMLGVVRVTS